MTTDLPLDSKQVAAFLAAFPNFFLEHPELVGNLRLPLPDGASGGLLEHQLNLLRQDNRRLRQKLASMLATAAENTEISERLQRFYLALLENRDDAAIGAMSCDFFRREFAIEWPVFLLCPIGDDRGEQDLLWPVLRRSELQHSVCGPLAEIPGHRAIFGDDCERIESAALLPLLSPQRLLGVFALGSSSRNRFASHQGRFFLDRIGAVIAHAMTQGQQDGADVSSG